MQREHTVIGHLHSNVPHAGDIRLIDKSDLKSSIRQVCGYTLIEPKRFEKKFYCVDVMKREVACKVPGTSVTELLPNSDDIFERTKTIKGDIEKVMKDIILIKELQLIFVRDVDEFWLLSVSRFEYELLIT